VLSVLTDSVSSIRGTIAHSLPSSLLAGSLLAIAATSFRLAAYRALGRHFTFQLALERDHQLVTSFPYNIVRHPGYTAFYATYVGVGLVLFTRDGWIRRVVLPMARQPQGLAGRLALAGIVVAAISHTWSLGNLISRPKAEDAMLKDRFGKKWDEWAKQVPYRLVPYIW
jgi:protein-S-isoprenylcysteine O-methyltransferase Ste14